LGLVPALATAGDCFETSILKPAPFMGNNGEVFQLADGSFWEIKYEYEYLYEYYPDVVICPAANVLLINGKRLNVSQVTGAARNDKKARGDDAHPTLIESQIDGDFEGWEGETIIKLINGQIWQQSEYYYEYYYSFMPDVLIYSSGGQYKMKVDGVDEAVEVVRLK
jgi:hypothetical protein